ncbi:MAG: MlaD family protein [Planctomycetota bacterium]
MSDSHHWKLGLFVVTCVVIGLATVAFLGAKQFDRRVEEVHLYFNEPVDGLSIGSELRLRGIPIGSVKEIGIAPDRVHVEVNVEVNVVTLENLGLRQKGEVSDPFYMKAQMSESGFRAFLERNALTGLAVINSDFFDELKGQAVEYDFDTPPRCVPTMPSVFKGLIGDIEATLREFRVLLPTTGEKLQRLLDTMDKTLVEVRAGELSSSLRETLTTINAELQSLSTGSLSSSGQGAIDEFRAAIVEARELFSTYDRLGNEVSAEFKRLDLAAASAAAQRTLEEWTNTGQGISQLSDDVRADLGTVLEALNAVRRLAELLERDPGSLIHGKTTRGVTLPEGNQ